MKKYISAEEYNELLILISGKVVDAIEKAGLSQAKLYDQKNIIKLQNGNTHIYYIANDPKQFQLLGIIKRTLEKTNENTNNSELYYVFDNDQEIKKKGNQFYYFLNESSEVGGGKTNLSFATKDTSQTQTQTRSKTNPPSQKIIQPMFNTSISKYTC